MKKIFCWLDKNFEPIIMATLFIIMTLIITVQVVLRFVFNGGFSWGEELARFIFVWLMFFGFSYATRNQRHIRINFFVGLFGEKVKKIMYIFVDLLFLGFLLILSMTAVNVTQSIVKYGDMAVTMKVSMNVVYSAGLVGFLLMSLRVIQGIIWKIRNFKAPFERFENFAGAYSGANENCLVTNSLREKMDLKEEIEEIDSTVEKGEK